LENHIKIIHEGKSNQKKRKKVQKSPVKVLKKIAPMSAEDWEVKRTGPSRYIREKSHGLKFPDPGGGSLMESENDTEEMSQKVI